MKMTNIKIIEELVQQELKEANEIHPQFHSDHEAIAVIAEEYDECKDELQQVERLISYMWSEVKENESIKSTLRWTKKRAMNLAAEAIQVAAMCEKGLARYADTENM